MTKKIVKEGLIENVFVMTFGFKTKEEADAAKGEMKPMVEEALKEFKSDAIIGVSKAVDTNNGIDTNAKSQKDAPNFSTFDDIWKFMSV